MIEAVMTVWGRNADLAPTIVGRLPDTNKDDFAAVYFYESIAAARADEHAIHASKLDIAVSVETERPSERTVAVMTLRWKGLEWDLEHDFGFGYPADSARFMFFEGNYSCDCNRFIFLRERYPDAHFPENEECGDEIEMVRFSVEHRPFVAEAAIIAPAATLKQS